MKSIEERFLSKVNKTNSCWLWIGSKNSHGYGNLRIKGKSVTASRVSYELYKGPIPEEQNYRDICVLHKCDVRACVNPDHLFIGSNADNMKDMVAKGRAYRSQGEKGGNAKLTNPEVLDIRSRLPYKGYRADLAKEFNVSVVTIGEILTRKSWKNV